MSLSVVKQPLIDEGVLSAGQLGLIGSALLFVYAVGKFMNGFIADYCNIRRFMATGLFVSALVNLIMGVLGFMQGTAGLSTVLIFISFAILWGINGWM
jgi:OPA family sugar phosphate sensor protein UhpC-like MFS transporter